MKALNDLLGKSVLLPLPFSPSNSVSAEDPGLQMTLNCIVAIMENLAI